MFRILLFLIPTLAAAEVSSVDLTRHDHRLHFGVSSAATLVGSTALNDFGLDRTESIVLSLMLVMSAGIIKEYTIDKEASPGDMKANTLGSFSGAMIAIPVLHL